MSLRACTDTFGNITNKIRKKKEKLEADNATYGHNSNSKTDGKQASIRWDLLVTKIN